MMGNGLRLRERMLRVIRMQEGGFVMWVGMVCKDREGERGKQNRETYILRVGLDGDCLICSSFEKLHGDMSN